jgi:hypothetical protein
MRDAAADILDATGLKPRYQDNQSPFVLRALAAEAKVARLEGAAFNIMPYLIFTIGDESPCHHPTMPSAVGAFMEAFGWNNEAEYRAASLERVRSLLTPPAGAAQEMGGES